MRIERHVFGSFSGYTTLAKSPALSEADCHLLESGSYSFGQTEDAAFTQSLSKTYAYFTRALPPDRRALTRVLPGTPDDDNRPTLRLVTLVLLHRDWDAELHGDVRLLLADRRLWEWDPSCQALPALDRKVAAPHRAIDPASVPKILALISQVERGFVAGQQLVLSPADFHFHDLRALEILVPPLARPHFTTAYLSLSANLPATVNCLASEEIAHRQLFRYTAGAVPLSTYAKHLESAGLKSGDLPLDAVVSYPTFGLQPDSTPAAPAPSGAVAGQSESGPRLTLPVPRPSLAGVAAVLAASAISFVAGRYVGLHEAAPPAKPVVPPVGSAQPATSSPTSALTDVQNDSKPLASNP